MAEERNLMGIATLALTIITVGIILTLGAAILSNLQKVQGGTTGTLRLNQTFTMTVIPSAIAHNITLNLSNAGANSVEVYNNTYRIAQSKNWTLSSEANVVNLTNGWDVDVAGTWLNGTTSLKVAYTYVINTTTIAYNASGYSLTGVNTLASYIPTVALVAILMVVVGIIIVMFKRK